MERVYQMTSGDIECKVDGSWHPSLEALHKHLRKIKMTQEVYYTQYRPQRDLCTAELIPFKAPAARYLKIEFAHKDNLKWWLAKKPEEGKKWSINWLAKRKAEKALVYPPLQVELRSLMCPSILYYDHIGGYAEICHQLGYTIRFSNEVPAARPLDCPVIVDTREQRELTLKVPTIEATVKCGDYALPPERDQGVYIERKSLSDFVGTLSDRETRYGDSNLLRFTRELQRVQELGAYMILLVEIDLKRALDFQQEPTMKHGKVGPEHIFKNLRDLFFQFPCFQALFVASRDEAAAAVPTLLSMGEAVRTFDLQWAYEKGKLPL